MNADERRFVAQIMRAVLPAICAALFGIAAHAADYPARPVRFIVAFPPGGGTDIFARVLAQKLAERLGQQFVVDNRPGAAGTIGAQITATSAPDAYTLLFVTATFAIGAGYYKNLPYDSLRDFSAVSLLASGPLLLVVHPSVQANSIRELVALARSMPGKLNYASGGAGGINHLAGELFNSLAGTRFVHVPYKGAGPALTSLMSGEVQMMIATLGSAISHVKSGKLKALAVGGDRRTATLPEMPTISEAGVRGYSADNWYGMLAPRGTPAAIVKRLNAEIAAALANDDTRAQLLKLGFEPLNSTPAEFGAYLKRDIEKWARVMKAAGVVLQATP